VPLLRTTPLQEGWFAAHKLIQAVKLAIPAVLTRLLDEYVMPQSTMKVTPLAVHVVWLLAGQFTVVGVADADVEDEVVLADTNVDEDDEVVLADTTDAEELVAVLADCVEERELELDVVADEEGMEGAEELEITAELVDWAVEVAKALVEAWSELDDWTEEIADEVALEADGELDDCGCELVETLGLVDELGDCDCDCEAEGDAVCDGNDADCEESEDATEMIDDAWETIEEACEAIEDATEEALESETVVERKLAELKDVGIETLAVLPGAAVVVDIVTATEVGGTETTVDDVTALAVDVVGRVKIAESHTPRIPRLL
jgi:hypothetical protein